MEDSLIRALSPTASYVGFTIISGMLTFMLYLEINFLFSMAIFLDKCVCVFLHPILTQSKSIKSSCAYVLEVTNLIPFLRFYRSMYDLFEGVIYLIILFINQIGNVRRFTTYLLYFIQFIQAT